jgi:hypothetical protein
VEENKEASKHSTYEREMSIVNDVALPRERENGKEGGKKFIFLMECKASGGAEHEVIITLRMFIEIFTRNLLENHFIPAPPP